MLISRRAPRDGITGVARGDGGDATRPGDNCYAVPGRDISTRRALLQAFIDSSAFGAG